MKVCIIVPAHNEESRIAKTLEDFRKTVLKEYGSGLTLLVVTGGSTDRTDDIVSGYTRTHRWARHIRGQKRAGKGGDLIKGFEIAMREHGPWIMGFVDADDSVSGKEVLKLLGYLRDHDLDGVIASRYAKGAKITGNIGRARFVASRAYNLMVRLLFGMDFMDTQCGAKFFRAGSLRRLLGKIKLTDMSFDINLLYEMRRRGLRVAEVPITYDVVKEHSKMRLGREAVKMFIVTLGYRVTVSRIGGLIPVSLRNMVYYGLKGWN